MRAIKWVLDIKLKCKFANVRRELLPHLCHEVTTYEMDPGLQVQEYSDHCPSG